MYHPRLLRNVLALTFVVAATVAAPAQNLTVTTDLQLWLKADAGITLDGGGGVMQWDDQSGNANHAVQPVSTLAPVSVPNALNSRPVLRFDGVDDYLSVASSPSVSFTGDLTTFFVVRFSDFSTYRAVWAKTANNFPAPTDYYILPGNGRPQVYRGSGTGAGLGSFASTVALTAGSYLTVGFGMEGTVCSHFLAGNVASSGTISVPAGDTGAPLLIGTRGDLFTKMKGEIAEILIYSRALTPAERTSVADYLAQKYGIVNLPPTISLNVTPAGPAHAPGDEITLTASASDPDGSVASVSFFANGSLLGTATAPPYRIRVALDTPGNYELMARAIDNKDGRADSTPVIRSVSAGSPPALGVTETLQLWLKADSGVTVGPSGGVMIWEDQSGKGNHATSLNEGMSPVVSPGAINSLPALHFDGVDDRLEVADSPSVSITGDLTTLFVVRMDNFATFRAVWAKTAGPSGNLPAPTDFYTLPNSGIPKTYRGDGSANSIGFVDGVRAFRAGQFELAGFSVAGSTLTHFLGGFGNGTGFVPKVTADGDTPLYIGTRHDQFTRLQGDLAEVLVFSAALSTAELRNVQTYLAAKYGKPLASALNSLPTGTLTAPAGGTVVVAPADLTLTAESADSDGSIVRVEFLVNGGVAASDTTAPYNATVNFPMASAASVQVRMIDNLGGVSLSAPVSITVDQIDPVPVPAVSNLRLWLRADQGVTEVDGGVAAWNDQSGNFNNPIQVEASKRPRLVSNAINGEPALRFDGLDDSLVAPSSPGSAIEGDITTFFVVKFDDFDFYRAVWAKTQVNLPASTDFYLVPGTGLPRVFRGNGSGSAGFSDAQVAPTAGSFEIIGFDQSGTTLHHYRNGLPNGEGTIGAVLGDTGAPLYIGTRGDQFTRMKGEIAEILIYDVALTAEDRGTVFNYLGRRYGIATTPVLSIVNNGDGTVTVSWPSNVIGWELEVAPSLQGPWDPITFGVINNEYIDFIGERAFYRLRQQ